MLLLYYPPYLYAYNHHDFTYYACFLPFAIFHDAYILAMHPSLLPHTYIIGHLLTYVLCTTSSYMTFIEGFSKPATAPFTF